MNREAGRVIAVAALASLFGENPTPHKLNSPALSVLGEKLNPVRVSSPSGTGDPNCP